MSHCRARDDIGGTPGVLAPYCVEMALTQEFRFAARMLARNKGWTIIAVLALALGLGANIAIFSVVGLMVWTPLPYPHPEQLVYIPQTNHQRGFSHASVSLRDTRDWASAST